MLTEKQKRFVDYYVSTGNAAEAARKAGYKQKNADVSGRENLRKPAVRSAIDNRLKELESHRIADAKEVMEFLTLAMRGQLNEEVVVNEGTGKGFSEARNVIKQIGAKDRLKAAELLTKRYGLQQPAEAEGTDDKIEFIFKRGDDDAD